jgi:transcriptional regulator with XRE-family HTH domain
VEEQILGDVIRGLRVQRRLTQEVLADGICSASSLSKIENGSQVPSRQTFCLLMERLGEPGYTYAHFTTEGDYHFYLLTYELMEAMEYKELERVDEKLWQMQQLLPEEDRTKQQVFRMAQQVWYHMCGVDDGEYVNHCMEIFRMRRPDCELPEHIQNLTLDFVEVWVVNNMAVGLLWEQKPLQALRLLLTLHHQIRMAPAGTKGIGKMRGILCNNIALCLVQLEQWQEAEVYCDKGIRAMQREGGLLLEMQLCRVKMEIAKCQGEMDAYYDYLILLRLNARLFPQIWMQQGAIEEILWKEKEILII